MIAGPVSFEEARAEQVMDKEELCFNDSSDQRFIYFHIQKRWVSIVGPLGKAGRVCFEANYSFILSKFNGHFH